MSRFNRLSIESRRFRVGGEASCQIWKQYPKDCYIQEIYWVSPFAAERLSKKKCACFI